MSAPHSLSSIKTFMMPFCKVCLLTKLIQLLFPDIYRLLGRRIFVFCSVQINFSVHFITYFNTAANICIILKLIPQLLNKQMRNTSVQQQKNHKSKSMDRLFNKKEDRQVIQLDESLNLNENSVVTDNSEKFQSEKISLPSIKKQSNRSQASPPKYHQRKFEVRHKFIQEIAQKKKIIDEIEEKKQQLAELLKKCENEKQDLSNAKQKYAKVEKNSNLEFMKHYQKIISGIRNSIRSKESLIIQIKRQKGQLQMQLKPLKSNRR